MANEKSKEQSEAKKGRSSTTNTNVQGQSDAARHNQIAAEEDSHNNVQRSENNPKDSNRQAVEHETSRLASQINVPITGGHVTISPGTYTLHIGGANDSTTLVGHTEAPQTVRQPRDQRQRAPEERLNSSWSREIARQVRYILAAVPSYAGNIVEDLVYPDGISSAFEGTFTLGLREPVDGFFGHWDFRTHGPDSDEERARIIDMETAQSVRDLRDAFDREDGMTPNRVFEDPTAGIELVWVPTRPDEGRTSNANATDADGKASNSADAAAVQLSDKVSDITASENSKPIDKHKSTRGRGDGILNIGKSGQAKSGTATSKTKKFTQQINNAQDHDQSDDQNIKEEAVQDEELKGGDRDVTYGPSARILENSAPQGKSTKRASAAGKFELQPRETGVRTLGLDRDPTENQALIIRERTRGRAREETKRQQARRSTPDVARGSFGSTHENRPSEKEAERGRSRSKLDATFGTLTDRESGVQEKQFPDKIFVKRIGATTTLEPIPELERPPKRNPGETKHSMASKTVDSTTGEATRATPRRESSASPIEWRDVDYNSRHPRSSNASKRARDRTLERPGHEEYSEPEDLDELSHGSPQLGERRAKRRRISDSKTRGESDVNEEEDSTNEPVGPKGEGKGTKRAKKGGN